MDSKDGLQFDLLYHDHCDLFSFMPVHAHVLQLSLADGVLEWIGPTVMIDKASQY